jgi:branched-chain amino acid transport system permease protein
VTAASPRVERYSTGGRVGLVLAAALVLGLLSGPFWLPSDAMRLVVQFACLLAMSQMWNLLVGYGGLVSIGQQAYIGIGGYALFVLANQLGLNPLVANISALGSGAGVSLTAMLAYDKGTRESITFWLAVVLLIATTGGVYWLLRSPLGLALTAMRDSDIAAESQGVAVGRMKLLVYVLAAFGTGCAGALYFMNALRISPDAAFGMDWIPLLFFTVIIGGIGTIEGPIVGTLLYFTLRQVFGDYGAWYLIALGVVAIVVMIRFPRGIYGELAVRFGWRFFPIQRILREPT